MRTEPPEAGAATPAPPPPAPKAPQAELFTRAPSGTPSDWHEELSDRVEKFKQRRARLRGDSDQNLDFDFEKGESPETDSGFDEKVIEFPGKESASEMELGDAAEGEPPLLDATPLEKSAGDQPGALSEALDAGNWTLEREARHVEPMEILVPSTAPDGATLVAEVSPLVLPLAPLGRRFVAGVADALVLLVGACLFTLIFWRAGGHLSPQPLNLAALGFIVVFFLMVYFGLFTALTSATPGLLWMGLEVRNMDGNYPSPNESLVRAFGYLVSISALMLGFLWAAVDSDGLTWHDRMSGTFITVATTR